MEEKIYPRLPTAPGNEYTELVNKTSSNYRLVKINEIESYLEKESITRQHLSKKYHRANQVISSADGTLSTVTIGLGIGGVALLSTVVATPVVLIIESASIGTGFLCVLAKYVNKKLQAKVEKHKQIHILAESKLNTVHSHISKAIIDGHVSDEEFGLILEEVEKYKIMKEDLKKKKLKDSEKNSLLERGKNDLIKKFENFYNSEI